MPSQYREIIAGDGGKFQAYVSVPPAGHGPGIVVLQEIFGVNQHVREVCERFAEEGYVAIAPDLFWRIEPGIELGYAQADLDRAFELYGRFDVDQSIRDVADTLEAFRRMPELKGKVGAIGYCLGGKLAYLCAARTAVDCAVSYYGVGIEKSLDEAEGIKVPLAMHFAGEDKFVPNAAVETIRNRFKDDRAVEIYHYPGVDHGFNCDHRPGFDKPAAGMAYTRTLALLRRVLGAQADLSALWDAHCRHEFATRDVAATMRSMVAEPYVNHIPTMTGGVGHDELERFYQHHFIPKCPKDTRLVPISRTIGTDRLVDEMVFCFTHDIEIDWMLPGVAPTGRYVEVPLVAIVCFRGEWLYHEHIYWDQASVLVQIGLLDATKLPVAGIESAKKLLDETLPSNTLMKRWAESAGSP